MSIDPVTRAPSDAVTSYFEPAKTRPDLHIVTPALVQIWKDGKILFEISGDVPKALGMQVKYRGGLSDWTKKKYSASSRGFWDH